MNSNLSNLGIGLESNTKWIDVTQDFFESIKYLELGELLHDECFGLFEAMSAIEMMDPKMDAGMLCNKGNKCKQINLDYKNIPYDLQIGIIDETFSCLVSWLGGEHCLAQTLFTNIYLHNPEQIENQSMRTFCISIYKLIDLIRYFINKGVIYEEEDFQPMLFGYKLNTEYTNNKVITMLRNMEENLNKLLNKNDDPNSAQQIKALNVRLKFTRLILQCFVAFDKLENICVGEIQKILTTCHDLIPQVVSTIHLGVQSENGRMFGFDPQINQRLLPPTFPRYTKIRPRPDAYEYLGEVLNRLKHVCKITNCNTNYQTALDLFVEISRLHPCLISRSIMQVLYMPRLHMVHGTTPLVEVLRESVKSFISPPFLSSKSPLANHMPAKEAVDVFLGHCVRPFGALIQMCGQNRARQRDRLAHLLEEFSALQDEAERVDAFLHTLSQKYDPARSHLACFGTWILYYTLRIISMYLLAGFELELYSSHEYYYIYWYLYEFLYAWHISALTRSDNFLFEQELLNEQQQQLQQQSQQQKSKHQQKKNKNKKKKVRNYNKEIVLYQALQNACGGYYKACIGFRLDGKIRSPYPHFSSERIRFEHRFSILSTMITPPPMQYSDFLESFSQLTQNPEDLPSLYISASKHFHTARSLLESIPNPDNQIQDLIKIMKNNFIVTKLFATTHSTNEKILLFDFTTHACYPIFKI